MWKALLVEDEPIVRRTVVQLIDWEGSGFRLIGEAEHGEEALAIMRTEQPELVITDILMPRVDGLELLEQARREGMEPIFVMLTCMNEFEYARRALELGAYGYVLKLSLSPSSMIELLTKVNQELTKRHLDKTQLEFHRTCSAVWDLYAGRPARLDGAYWNRQSIPEPVSRYRYVTIVCTLDGGAVSGGNAGSRRSGPAAGLYPAITYSYRAAGFHTLFIWTREPYLWEAPQQPTDAATAVIEGIPAERWTDAWFLLLGKLNEGWYDGRRSCERPDAEELPAAALANRHWPRELELPLALEKRRSQGVAGLLRELWQEMKQLRLPAVVVKECAVSWVQYVKPRLPEQAEQAIRSINEAVSHDDLYPAMADLFDAYERKRREGEVPVIDHPEVDLLVRHIHAHYADELTLRSAAEMVRMDESYLSSLFSKKTGTPFIQYVQKVRVERAKHALAHSEIPVQEIGEQVGFANLNYFFKVFKKQTGMTPNDYRRKLRTDFGPI